MSSIKLTLTGRDELVGDNVSLSSLGLVNGDLVYALSSAFTEGDACSRNAVRPNGVLLSQLFEMGFNQDVAKHALVQANNTSVAAALEFIAGCEPNASQVGSVSARSAKTTCSQPQDATNRLPAESLPSTSAGYYKHGPAVKEHENQVVVTRNVMSMPSGPIFCRDGISSLLQTLYDLAGIKTQHEAMFLILHALVLESGLQLKDNSGDCAQLNNEMPAGWSNKTVSRLQYVHRLCPSLSCNVVVSSLGPFVYAHGEHLHRM